MTDVSILYEINQLPEKQKMEVIDFILMLKNKIKAKDNKLDSNKRIFGISKGKYLLANDFDEPLEDFNKYLQ